jgi:hypothetical protein
MKELLDKLKKLIYSLEAEKKSEFLICAMILPGESNDKWDFILSAPWLNSSELESYKLISSKLQTSLMEAELLQIARIVILDPDDQVVKFLQTLVTVTNGGYKELRAEELTEKFKFIIKRAYLLRSIPESRKY